MKIRLAHHYWRDKTNATWSPERFPFPVIEDEIKRNYALLEAERPKWKQYGGITVFFDYRPTKDIYGRDIVPISFAFVPDCKNPAQCYPAVAKRLKHAPVSQTKMELPDSSLGISKKTRLPIIFAVSVVLLIIIIAAILFLGDREKPQRVIPVSETKEDTALSINMESVEKQAVEPDATAPNIKNNKKMEKAENVEHPSADKPVASDHEKSVLEPFPLCAQVGLRELMTECARIYFATYCDSRVKKIENFGKWNVETKDPKCSRNDIIRKEKYIIFKGKPKINGKIKDKVETIFKTGR